METRREILMEITDTFNAGISLAWWTLAAWSSVVLEISVETANKLLLYSKMFVYSLEGKHLWHQVFKMCDVTWNPCLCYCVDFVQLIPLSFFVIWLRYCRFLLPVKLNRIAFCDQPQPWKYRRKECKRTNAMIQSNVFLQPVSPEMMNGLQVCWMQNSSFSQLIVSQCIRAVPKRKQFLCCILEIL